MKKTRTGANSWEGTSLTTDPSRPKRGEIWYANLDPTIGAEIKKKRPVVVVSSDAINKLPIKLVAPITGWKDHFAENLWHVRIDPDRTNGLSKPATIDTLQLRGIDAQRFLNKLGRVSSSQMEEITAAIAAVIEYE
jgi:mRNA interferase MazF